MSFKNGWYKSGTDKLLQKKKEEDIDELLSN
jgi:hypothetical protein